MLEPVKKKMSQSAQKIPAINNTEKAAPLLLPAPEPPAEPKPMPDLTTTAQPIPEKERQLQPKPPAAFDFSAAEDRLKHQSLPVPISDSEKKQAIINP